MKSLCALLCLTVIFYLTGKSIPESGGVLNPVSNPTGTFTDSRDGKTYKTVKIGNQWWMAENLAYLPAVSQVTSGSSTEKHYYVFGYDGTSVGEAKATANYSNYGVLYNWTATINGSAGSDSNPSGVQGVCPSGWHLPSDAEWKEMEKTLGMTQDQADATGYRGTDQGSQIKTSNGWTNAGNGTNSSGFSAFPGGTRDYNGVFSPQNSSTSWWSATIIEPNSGIWLRSLYYSENGIYRNCFWGEDNKARAFSVRCVKTVSVNQADLTPSNFQFTPQTINPGAHPDAVSFRLTNNGPSNLADPNTHVDGVFYISKNSTYGDGDDIQIGVNGYDFTIASGTSQDVILSATGKSFISIPSGASGDYYVFVRVEHKSPSELTDPAPGNDFAIRAGTITVPIPNQTGTTTDSRDGKTYKTVKIGNQWWMAENLAYLPTVTPPSDGSSTNPRFYVYGYSGTDVIAAKATANYTTYGVLYNWPAAMNGGAGSSGNPSVVQGICPSGWHLPSDAEWQQLEISLGMTQSQADQTGLRGTDQGTQMKTTSGWNNNGNGSNTSGFTGRPGGVRDINSTFKAMGNSAYFWTSTDFSGTDAWSRNLDSEISTVNRFNSGFMDYGFSVRCVKTVSVNQADLTPSNFQFSPQTIQPGANPDAVSFRLTNNGPSNLADPNTHVDGVFYISKNSTYGDGDDIQIGVNGYDFTIASGASQDVILSATGKSFISIPSGASGDYYVFVRVEHKSPSALTDPAPGNDFAIRTGTITVVPSPGINVSVNTLSEFGNTEIGTCSTTKNYTVSGTGLTANIIITAPTGFQVSTSSSSGFANSLTLPQSAGTVPSTTIFVKFCPGTSGTFAGSISHSSSGVASKNVSVSGKVPEIPNNVTLNITDQTGVAGGSVAIPVNATNFADVVGFQFTIVYDKTKLDYVNCTNWSGGANVSDVQINHLSGDGKITFVYNDVPVNIANGKFFDLNFIIKSGATGSAQLSWNDTPTLREISNSSGVVVPCSYYNGSLTVLIGWKLSGILTYPNYSTAGQTPLSNTQVSLLNSVMQPVSSTTTDNSGYFEFNNLQNGNYNLKPQLSIPWGGVTAMDITFYKKHIGNVAILSPLQAKSGDVNGNGNLTTIDLTVIKQRIIASVNSFTVGDWAFSQTTPAIYGAALVYNINALCYGDANGSYIPPVTTKSSANVFLAGNLKAWILPTGELEVPFTVDKQVNKLSSVTLAFNYPSDLLELNNIEMADHNEDLTYAAQNGVVKVIYSTLNSLDLKEGETLFKAKFRIKTDHFWSDLTGNAISFSGQGEFGDFNDRVLKDVHLLYGGLDQKTLAGQFNNGEVVIYPNPARTTLNIRGIDLAEVKVYDMCGRSILYENNIGDHVEMDLSKVTPGTYTVSVHMKNGSINYRKVVVLK